MELTVMATGLVVSVGVGVVSARMMMSIVFACMARSVVRVEHSRG
jgi:hypothetical protein